MDKKKHSEGLTTAFENDDRHKILKLTAKLPPSARSTVMSVLRVFKEKQAEGMTPFVSAILHKNQPLCELLIEDGIDMGFPKNERNDNSNVQSFFNNLVIAASFRNENGQNEIQFERFKHTNPMFWAIKGNYPELVLKLLTHGYGKDSPVENLFDMVPLYFAVNEGNVKVVEVLLNNSADLHLKNSDLATALDMAIICSRIDMVRLLMLHGEDPNCRKHLNSPLIEAIDNLDMLKCLIELGANIDVAWVRDEQIPPLHYAILNLPRCANAAVWLIQSGADVNLKDQNGNTPLNCLAWLIDLEWKVEVTLEKCRIAQTLLEKGAEVDAKNSDSMTPLCGAACSLNIELFDILLSAGADINTYQGNPPASILERLVSVYVMSIVTELSETEFVTNTKLLTKQLSLVRILLSKGAHVNAKDKIGQTPLHAALSCEGHNLEIVKLLVEGGADINCQDNFGCTPLCLSISTTNLQTVQYLIEQGANVNKTDPNMISPLENGLNSKHYKIVKCLIQAGADLNERYRKGDTPLHIAAQQGNLPLVNILVESGADIHSRNSEGILALDFCIMICPERSPEFLQLFLDFGFDVNLDYRFRMTWCDFIMLLSWPSCNKIPCLKMIWRQGCPLKVTDANMKNGESEYLKYNQLIITQTKFMTGIKENNIELVLTALEEGAEPKGCSQDIPFPLHYLAKHSCHDILKVLLDKRVNTNILDKNGVTPLQLAARQKDVKTCRMLLQHGACFSKAACELSSESSQDNLPSHQNTQRLFRKIKRLFGLARRGDVSLLKHLEKSVNDKDPSSFWSLMNCIDNRGDTLLASAVRGGHGDLANKLMRLRLSFKAGEN